MEALSLILTTIIAVMAFLTALGFVFNVLLSPVKKDLAKLEVGQAKLEAKVDKILEKIQA